MAQHAPPPAPPAGNIAHTDTPALPVSSRKGGRGFALISSALLLIGGIFLLIVPISSQHPPTGSGLLLSFAVLLAIEEAGVPLPVPGDVGVLYLGYLIGQGAASPWQVGPILLTAVLCGSTILYALSRRWGGILASRLLRRVPEERVAQAERLIARYGVLAIAGARIVPGLRIVCSLVAGSVRIRYPIFVGGVSLCSSLWITILLIAGSRLGSWTQGRQLNSGTMLSSAARILGAALIVLACASLLRDLWITRRQRQ